MQREKFLLQLYMDDLRRENQSLRLRLAETMIERDRLKRNVEEYTLLKLSADRIAKIMPEPRLAAERLCKGGPNE